MVMQARFNSPCAICPRTMLISQWIGTRTYGETGYWNFAHARCLGQPSPDDHNHYFDYLNDVAPASPVHVETPAPGGSPASAAAAAAAAAAETLPLSPPRPRHLGRVRHPPKPRRRGRP